jgi:hypothetical protein
MQDKDDDMIRIHLMDLTDAILPLIDDEDNSTRFANMRSRFFERIWEKIVRNVERGHYPVVIRYYLQLFNFEDPTRPQWIKDERNKLYAYMRKELAPRLVKGEHMLNGDLKEKRLLPDIIKFNKVTKRFYVADKTKPIAWKIK